MGEKGIAADALGAVDSGAASVIERTTTVVTSTLTDVGQTAAETVRDRAVDAAVDQAAEAARERLTDDEDPDATTEDGGSPAGTT
jgi:hypothetical protein